MVDRVVDLMNCTDSLKEHIIWKLFCKYLQVLYRVECICDHLQGKIWKRTEVQTLVLPFQ